MSTDCVDHHAELTIDGLERTFRAPADGGYVAELVACRGQLTTSQPCRGLRATGPTLLWSPSMGDLADLIRREAKQYGREVTP